MNRFVEQCRREWDRLGVPDAIANEMAADLTADLDEAEADGVSAEEVLGTGIFDPRAFAASWAEARGLIDSPLAEPRRRRHLGLVAAAAVASALVALVALAVVGAGRGSVSVAAVHRSIGLRLGGGTIRALPVPGPFVDHTRFLPVGLQVVALIVFLLGVLGVVAAILYWSPWKDRLRSSRSDPRRLSH